MDLTPTQPQLSHQTDLKRRVLTGVLGGGLLILLLFVGGWFGSLILTLVIALSMIYEFSNMVLTLPDQQEKRYVLLLLTWLIVLCSAFLPKAEFELLLFSFIFLFSYFMVTSKRYADLPDFSVHFRELMAVIFGLVYLAFFPTYLPKIHESVNGIKWVIVFLIINWLGDSAAYFVGKRYGRRKLFPLISPKKTYEGAFGGLGCSVFGVLLFKLIFFSELSWFGALLTPILVSLAAQLGDFLESFVKRAFERKDSGSILPGHGGFLDRFDGFVISLPIMYACVKLLGK